MNRIRVFLQARNPLNVTKMLIQAHMFLKVFVTIKKLYVPYNRHYNPLLIINSNEKWSKNIQAAAYNDAHMVFSHDHEGDSFLLGN